MKILREKPILRQFPPIINPRKQLNQLYFSFMHSYLKYANLTWGFYSEKQIVYSLLSTKAFNYVTKFLRSVYTLQTSFKETDALNVYKINIFNMSHF